MILFYLHFYTNNFLFNYILHKYNFYIQTEFLTAGYRKPVKAHLRCFLLLYGTIQKNLSSFSPVYLYPDYLYLHI